MNLTVIEKLQEHFQAQLTRFISNHPRTSRWVVALSGGLDSRVLLDLLVNSASEYPIQVVHVNHGLNSHADQWSEFCSQVCESYSSNLEVGRLAFVSHQVHLASGSIEEKAREARYQIFDSEMKSGDVLLMAHHLNDQAETFFQRVVRGAGLTGLRSIPKERSLSEGVLFRPLLSVSRIELEEYANAQGLEWVDDESNASTVFDRNFIRHQVIPTLVGRWPKALQSISRTLGNLDAETQSLAFYRQQWLDANASTNISANVSASESTSKESLCIKALMGLPKFERSGLLAYWVREMSGYSITSVQLDTLINEVVLAQQDAQSVLKVGRLEFRRYQERLYCFLNQGASIPENWCVNFQLVPDQISEITLPDGSVLRFEPDVNGLNFPLESLSISYRKGGERIKPVGDAHTRDLKKWLQQQNMPPWQRSCVPLLYCKQQLLAVADLCADQACQSVENGTGWKVVWQQIQR